MAASNAHTSALNVVAKVVKDVKAKSSRKDLFSDEENIKIDASTRGEYKDGGF
jgi:hypothetical protein